MLDNTGGAFPGGKALWYAALKIWDSNVKGSEPPSLSTSSAAVKRLQSRNEAKEVVYGFKDSSGRYVTCSLVLRDHMDPNGPAATRMKRRIQEVHPNLYIPPPFSLSREEHLKFEDMDDTLRSGDTPKKQGRRDEKLLETVEVLNAPFYAKSGIKSVRARKRAIEEDDERPEDKRRKRDATQQLLEGRPAKRSRKAESKKPKDFVSYTDDEGYEDEDEDGEAWSSDHRRRARRPTADGEDILEQLGSFQSRETTIVPPPKRYRILAKSGAYSGNPGINSLPSSFFSRTDAIDNKQPTSSAEVRFLQPNTRLEESEGEEDRDDFGSIAFSAAPDRTNLSGAKSDANDVVPERFSGTIVLSDSQGSRGSWPALDDKFFQENDGSFAMRGWMPNPQDLSRELLPRSSQEMAGRLSNRFKPESWADPAWGYYCQTVEQCKKWELSDDGTQVMGSVRVAPDYIFINFSSTQSVSSMAQISDLQWLEENNWTLQTIPYNSLEDDTAEDFDELFGIIRRGPRRGRGRPRGRGGRRSLAGPASRGESGPQQRKKDVVPMEKARELTAYPRTSDDYIRPSESISGDLDWGATNTRIAAFVCTSTLLGGLNRAQDWGLLMRLFPDMKISRLRRYWKEIRKEREGFIQDLTETFQDAFLEAYESGELPPIDYDDLLAYDWPGLIKWTLQLTTQKSVQLPASREELEESFNVEDAEVDTRDWREDYYHWQRSIFKRFQDATSEAAAMAVQPVGPKRNVDDLAVLARSWVRAVCVTAENKYPSSLIREKLSKLGGLDAKQINGLLHDAINELESRKILRRRPRTSAGPPYSLNERFETSLSRYSQEDKLTQAIAFKSKLDEAFRRNEKVEVPYILDDGMIMAIMNLQAAGRVRTEPLSEPNIPFGFRPGFYETRQLPKKHYHWSLRVAPTETYLYNEDIDILKKAAGAAIPGERPDGKLPVWCDIFGDVEKGRWARLLGAVSFMLATRGAMTVERTFAALKTVTEVFEVEVIMQWAKELGILVEVIDGGALTVAEWWWLVCGSQLGGHAGDAGPPKTAVAEEDS
ncbi:Transcription factor tau subunit sfc3 [Pleurostoma richardsiae]|uniref:Transcription factor tau subunit sfc3 n=1 Tax=Pleurostoma richardsiae TaxID=41990 RepID=A0AA38RHK1_9PEZI|nr:Transcription factor tau subunit sfc3 [Pleurostoma richardsiae]